MGHPAGVGVRSHLSRCAGAHRRRWGTRAGVSLHGAIDFPLIHDKAVDEWGTRPGWAFGPTLAAALAHPAEGGAPGNLHCVGPRTVLAHPEHLANRGFCRPRITTIYFGSLASERVVEIREVWAWFEHEGQPQILPFVQDDSALNLLQSTCMQRRTEPRSGQALQGSSRFPGPLGCEVLLKEASGGRR
jgi:hypothetical protein